MCKGMYASFKRILAIVIVFSMITILQCVSLQATGGTGSETVIGKLIHEDGTPAGKTVVTLHPYNFDPVSNSADSNFSTDTTDCEGWYKITLKSPKIKNYSLQAINLFKKTRAIIHDINLPEPGESTLVATASLHKTGSIKVILSDLSANGNEYVFIPGTTFHSYVQNGYAIIDSVPADTIRQVYFKNKNETGEPLNLAENVDVKPEISTVITFSGSAHARKLSLNTTLSGADIAGNVLGFPVLIRLSGNNFNFKEARADGSDLRFTKSDNTLLPFEIERWDSVAQQAEIWVKVDTVYGNDSSHFVVMYWGEPAASMAINHANVFDTVNGFKGVWHLAEEAPGVGTKGLYKDATGLNNGDDYISSTDRTGIIGYGHAFNGIDDYIPVNSPVTAFIKGEISISLWVDIKDSGGTILSKLDTNKIWSKGESSLYFGNGTDTFGTPGSNGNRPSFVEYTNSYAIASQPVTPGNWHYLAFTWKYKGDSTGTSRYFIDGAEVSLSQDSVTVRVNESTNATVRIGQPNNNESFAYFKGLMDELEISSVARSADWIKLSYMNQRIENVFVKY